MKMIDTNAKFNMSFLSSPKQQQAFTSVPTDLQVKIKYKQQKAGGVTGFQYK